MTDPDTRSRFVERMGGGLTSAGLARLPSRIFAALLIDEDGRMTAAELVDVLGVSAASVSGAVRYLDTVGMIHRERERGSRRDVFVVDDDAWHTAMMRVDQTYAPLLDALDRALREIPDDDPAQRRLHLSAEFLRFVSAEMAGLTSRWEAHLRAL